MDYEITISGSNVNLTQNFTNTYTLSNLPSGTYSVCITGTDGAIVYEQNCYDVDISEPDPLSVSLKTNFEGKQVTLDLQGADLYFIELNGNMIETRLHSITLDLKQAHNTLKVTTGQLCQGVFEEQIVLTDEVLIYPNPVYEITTVRLAKGPNAVTVDIFDQNGRFIKRKNLSTNQAEFELDFTGLPSGIYMLKFKGENLNTIKRVIKK